MFDDKPDPVEEHWPYDGPHDPDTVESAAHALPALMRYLNNATKPASSGESLPSAPAVRRVTGYVSTGTDRLDQLVQQLGIALSRHMLDPSLFDERGPDYSAADTLDDVLVHLDRARLHLVSVTDELSQAYSAVGRIGHDAV